MIRLIENSSEALDILNSLKCDCASVVAAEMLVAGKGIERDHLDFYGAYNADDALCGAFVKNNDRVFCLIDTLFDAEEITLFLRGFNNYKIFISENFSYLIERDKFYYCLLMSKSGDRPHSFTDEISYIDSKTLTEILMGDKDKESKECFFLNNSYLLRHGYMQNFAYTTTQNDIASIAGIFDSGSTSYLCNVFTPVAYRHQGYSLKLVSQITDACSECHLICNESVSELYEKCGFHTYAKWIEFLY